MIHVHRTTYDVQRGLSLRTRILQYRESSDNDILSIQTRPRVPGDHNRSQIPLPLPLVMSDCLWYVCTSRLLFHLTSSTKHGQVRYRLVFGVSCRCLPLRLLTCVEIRIFGDLCVPHNVTRRCRRDFYAASTPAISSMKKSAALLYCRFNADHGTNVNHIEFLFQHVDNEEKTSGCLLCFCARNPAAGHESHLTFPRLPRILVLISAAAAHSLRCTGRRQRSLYQRASYAIKLVMRSRLLAHTTAGTTAYTCFIKSAGTATRYGSFRYRWEAVCLSI